MARAGLSKGSEMPDEALQKLRVLLHRREAELVELREHIDDALENLKLAMDYLRRAVFILEKLALKKD